MRPAHLSLLSLALFALPLACTLPDTSTCEETGDCSYNDPYPSSTYDSGATTAPTCSNPVLSITIGVPHESGDCRVSLSSYSSYGAGGDSVAYYFPTSSDGEAKTPCETLAGPPAASCARVLDMLTLRIEGAAEIATLRATLGMSSYAGYYGDNTYYDTIYATATCARSGSTTPKTVTIDCAAGDASSSGSDDASAGDAGALADGGAKDADAATSDAATSDAGCGP